MRVCGAREEGQGANLFVIFLRADQCGGALGKKATRSRDLLLAVLRVGKQGHLILVRCGPLTPVEEVNFAQYESRTRGNSGLGRGCGVGHGNPIVRGGKCGGKRRGPPKLLVKTLIRGILAPRLETRTKECYVCASIVVENHRMRNESEGK